MLILKTILSDFSCLLLSSRSVLGHFGQCLKGLERGFGSSRRGESVLKKGDLKWKKNFYMLSRASTLSTSLFTLFSIRYAHISAILFHFPHK